MTASSRAGIIGQSSPGAEMADIRGYTMKLKFFFAALPLASLGACVTTPETAAAQRASCEKMEADMGLGTTHDHAQMKGAGLNPMNLTHEQCMKMLGRS
jgi:hypothetical protein